MTSAATSPSSDSKRQCDTNSTNTMLSAIPQLLSTPGSHASQIEPKEYMKLTPIHLQCLASPLRPKCPMQRYGNEISSQISRESRIDDGYKENFNLISGQLEKLLEALNVIYRKIGYSNVEIIGKEKLIFNTLSTSITNFFDQAEKDMQNLSEENQNIQEILNRMLEIMRDSGGINTIPDIYVRNAILIPSCKAVFQSPKKPLSLLSKKKLLQIARGFVFKSYLPSFIKFMEVNIKLQALRGVVGEELSNLPNGGELGNDKMPNLNSLKGYREDLKSHQTDFDFISKYFMESKEDLLYNDNFNDISGYRIQILEKTAQIYEEEYNIRISILKSIANDILKLVSELETDLDPELRRTLLLYLQPDLRANVCTSVHKSIIESLQKILQEHTSLFEERKKIKETLLCKCRILWNRLKVPQAYIDSFMNQCGGYSAAVTKKIGKELEKLEEMKKKLIKTLIEESLQRIEELWSTLKYEAEEKTQFLYVFGALRESNATLEDDERLLETCESEIKSLEQKLSIYEPVLQLVQEFQSLRADKLSLEASSRDSSRLLARNSHKILLQEEKTRKRLTRHFPHVIKELKKGLEEVQTTFGKPLIVNGQPMMQVVSQVEDEIISKYPKSRLNLGRTRSAMDGLASRSRNKSSESKVTKRPIRENSKSCVPSTKTRTNRITRVSGASSKSNTVTSNNRVTRTPVAKITGALSRVNESRNVGWEKAQNRKCTKSFNLTSAVVGENSLLPPKLVTRCSDTRIPEPPYIARSESTKVTSVPHLKLQPPANLVRPNTLFLVPPNKMNQQKSMIPTMSTSNTSLNRELMRASEKENLVDSTPLFKRKGEVLNFSSPYREPDNSVYKISKSPDGKCTVNVRDKSPLENGLDDTSILDEGNDKDFNIWKNEQLVRMHTIHSNGHNAS